MVEGPRKVFVVVPGIPARFTDLSLAEEHAAEMCEKAHQDYTIFVTDAKAFDYALVARYYGVRLVTLEEASGGED